MVISILLLIINQSCENLCDLILSHRSLGIAKIIGLWFKLNFRFNIRFYAWNFWSLVYEFLCFIGKVLHLFDIDPEDRFTVRWWTSNLWWLQKKLPARVIIRALLNRTKISGATKDLTTVISLLALLLFVSLTLFLLRNLG